MLPNVSKAVMNAAVAVAATLPNTISIRPPVETAPEPAEVEISVLVPVRDEAEKIGRAHV